MKKLGKSGMCTKSENLNSYDGSVKCHLGVPMSPEILGTLLMERDSFVHINAGYFKLNDSFLHLKPIAL